MNAKFWIDDWIDRGSIKKAFSIESVFLKENSSDSIVWKHTYSGN